VNLEIRRIIFTGENVVEEHKIIGEKILFAAVVAVALAGTSANAVELPSYEVAGFPISTHQIAVLGSTANVKEQSPSPSLTMCGMPASPHQVAALRLATAAVGPRNAPHGN
jgi:hypothetical protein